MKKIIISTLCVMFLLVLFSVPVLAGSAENIEKNMPSLDRYQMNQFGDSEILLLLYGKGLPTPEIITTEGLRKTEIIFRDSINKAKSSDILPGSPVVSAIEFEQRENDAVIILHTTDMGILIKDMRGVGPADRFSMMLTTQNQQIRLETEAKLLETPLPPVPLISDFQKSAPVTLDVRDTALADIVRLLADYAKKNIIIDASLPNEYVTMTLNKVPLSSAIDHLKKMFDIDFALLGDSTIIAGSKNGLSRMTGRETTRAFHIAYADVTKMPAILTGVMRLSEEEQSNITIDDRLRQLYITASPERLDEYAVALQTLDSPGKQVMLQARIFEFNDSFSEEVDAMVNTIYDNWYLNYSAGVARVGVVTDSGLRGAVPSPTWSPSQSIIDGTWRYIDAAFQASEEKTNGKVLANPSVITYDGEEATIELTQERPYRVRQQGTSGTEDMYTTEFKEAGPTLRMRPMIGRDGVITIQLDLDSSEFTEWTADGPATATRQVTTNVRVRNGEPFVVGGLHSEVDAKIKRKIPVLGDIPLLGNLFRFVSDESRRTQVVMIVVPYILDTPDSKIEGASLLFRR